MSLRYSPLPSRVGIFISALAAWHRDNVHDSAVQNVGALPKTKETFRHRPDEHRGKYI